MYALTGPTGHLGQTILRQARSRNLKIRNIVRGSSDTGLLSSLGEQTVVAALDDVDSLVTAFQDCDVVIHTAALIDIRRGYLDVMRPINVDGTVNVLEACRRAGVKRLVYISSIEAIDLANPRRPVDETLGFARGDAVMEYGDTKAEASRIVADAGRERAGGGSGPEALMICPTGIVGPWDFRGGLFTTMIHRYIAGKIPAAIPGGFDFVDVREVAGAVLEAASGRGRSGEAYLASGHYLDVRNLLSLVGGYSGTRRSTPLLPVWLGKLGGYFIENWSRISGTPAMFTKGSIDVLQVDARVDPSKAESELGYRRRSIEATISDTVAWIQGRSEPSPEPAWREPELLGTTVADNEKQIIPPAV